MGGTDAQSGFYYQNVLGALRALDLIELGSPLVSVSFDKRAATQQINAFAQHAWKPADQPSWLTKDFYSEKIQPALSGLSGSSIAKVLSVSNSYARDIRKGLVVPHPRHWSVLAELVRFRLN